MHCRRIAASAVVALLALGSIAPSIAQSSKVYRVGYLAYGASANGAAEDFQRGLKQNGYVEGRNVAVEYRYGALEQLPRLASELVAMPVDVIVALGEPAALAARKATVMIPIVIADFASDPVKLGLAKSLARPGANVTGLTMRRDESWEKRISYIHEIVPKAKSVGVLSNPGNLGNESCVADIKAAAATLGMQVRVFEVREPKAVDSVFATLANERSDALAICWDFATLARAKTIGELALKLRIPTVTSAREYSQAGALLSVGVRVADQRRRAAYFVDRIIKGKKPEDEPIEQPDKVEIVINYETAKSIGVTIPTALKWAANEDTE